ncbi:MlaA family lipoprotein [Geminicoccus harenae]|uniref:MlaA family lipoprotein n=1 Tax=Geminicoccus harenae TaxID=2498453 RepID=UPI001C9786CC|nr:VacJ family lipoprotein [Geminicoccus harenae]
MSQQGHVARPVAILALALTLAGCATAEDPDPWEPVNRAIFSFNEVADRAVLTPVSRGYQAVVPEPVRDSVTNFLGNLREPTNFVNLALQGEREGFGTSVGRFFINTTLGVGGLFDAASAFGYQKQETRFGATLQKWGVGPGPYVVLPLFGPDVVRGAVGRVPDMTLNPTFYMSSDWPWITQRVTEGIDFHSRNMAVIEDLRRGSVDMYATVRSIYLQRLGAEIAGSGSDAQYDAIFEEEPDVE